MILVTVVEPIRDDPSVHIVGGSHLWYALYRVLRATGGGAENPPLIISYQLLTQATEA